MKLNPMWDLLFGALLLATVLWYRAERPATHQVSKWRQSLFYAALALTTLVLVGPVPHIAVRIFWVHMIQHILLMMLISPLIVLGSPFKVLLNSRFPRLRSLARGVASVRIIRFLFKPQVGFLIFLATLIATHFGPLANAGMLNSNVHCLELILFLLGGIIYYYPVLDGNPTPCPVSYAVRLGSLFAMMLPETMTGFFLYSGNKLLHSVHFSEHQHSGSGTSVATSLHDQHTGGALMWAMGMLIDSLWVVIAAKDWFAYEKNLAELEDE